jgi:hypothetical protein
MEKKYLDDVVPPAQKRSIRDIPVPTRNGRGQNPIHKARRTEGASGSDKPNSAEEIKITKVASATPEKRNGPASTETQSINESIRKSSRGKRCGFKRHLTWGGIVLAIIAIFLILSSFDSATVTINQKQVEASINKNIEIGDLSSSKTSYELGYRTIELAKESELVVEANSEEFVQKKASGIITIYNEYSKESQNLIKNTRFESPNGLIYRIQESVSVPGYTGSGDNIVAGKLDVEVVADEVGESYNTESATFTIPGFKDQEPYDFFSAETKTSITGGFDGVRKIVSDENIETAATQLKENVTNTLIEELEKQITSEFLAVYNSGYFSYQNIEQFDDPNSDGVLLKLKGEITAKVFNKVDLSNAVAVNTLNEYSLDQNVLIKDLDSGSLIITDEVVTKDVEVDGEIEEVSENVENLNVSGNLMFVWQNDAEEIKSELEGVARDKLGSVMKNFAGVSKVEAVIKPFWRSKFPTEAKNIKIKIAEN